VNRRFRAFVCAFVLVFAACGTGAPATGPAPPVAPDTAIPVPFPPVPIPDTGEPSEDSKQPGERAVGDDDTEVSDNEDDPGVALVATPDGPVAPDVTLDLDDGSTFVLADAQRPVMFVFWAEW